VNALDGDEESFLPRQSKYSFSCVNQSRCASAPDFTRTDDIMPNDTPNSTSLLELHKIQKKKIMAPDNKSKVAWDVKLESEDFTAGEMENM
jgi:hypothetical protein